MPELDAIRMRIHWSPSLGGSVTLAKRLANLPASDLLAVLSYYQEQLTWARALEAAVGWRR